MLFGSSWSNKCRFSHRKSCLEAASRISNVSHVDYVTTMHLWPAVRAGIDSALNELLDSVAIKPLREGLVAGRPPVSRTHSLRNAVRDVTVTYRYGCRWQLTTDRPPQLVAAIRGRRVPRQVQSVVGPSTRLSEWSSFGAQRKNKRRRKGENALCSMLSCCGFLSSLNSPTTSSSLEALK